MKRIDSYGATGQNEWTEGNAATGTPATVVSADFMNILQEEIVGIIEGAGLSLDQSNSFGSHDTTQLNTALNQLYVNASGGNMSGPLDMGGNAISNATSVSLQSDPVLPAQAARKSYVDGKVSEAETALSGLLPPAGSIVAFAGGYFTGSSNTGFTSTVNSAASLNAHLDATAPGWKVCDGSLLQDSESPFFNGSGRYLPDLTAGRFLRGSTGAGAVGGSDSVTLAVGNMPSHTHVISHTHADHYHSIAHDHASYANNGLFLQAGGGTQNKVSSTWTSASDSGNDLNVNVPSYSGLSGSPVNSSGTGIDISFSGSSGSTGGLGSTSSSGTPGAAATAFSIEPKYLNVLFIMRIK